MHEGHDLKEASITEEVTGRAVGCESPFLRENHRTSGVTFKVRATWVAGIDSVCMASSRPADKPGQRSSSPLFGTRKTVIH